MRSAATFGKLVYSPDAKSCSPACVRNCDLYLSPLRLSLPFTPPKLQLLLKFPLYSLPSLTRILSISPSNQLRSSKRRRSSISSITRPLTQRRPVGKVGGAAVDASVRDENAVGGRRARNLLRTQPDAGVGTLPRARVHGDRGPRRRVLARLAEALGLEDEVGGVAARFVVVSKL